MELTAVESDVLTSIALAESTTAEESTTTVESCVVSVEEPPHAAKIKEAAKRIIVFFICLFVCYKTNIRRIFESNEINL
jgi:hypothetical protein